MLLGVGRRRAHRRHVRLLPADDRRLPRRLGAGQGALVDVDRRTARGRRRERR